MSVIGKIFGGNLVKRFLRVGLVIGAISLLVMVMTYAKGNNVLTSPQVAWVSHTEYWQDDYASTIVRLTDYKGTAFNVDSCQVTILKPDKSILVSNAPMTQSGITGNWYRTDSLVGQPEGTFEQEVTCVYNGDQQIKTSQSFHLNPALNYIKTVDDNLLAIGASLTNLDLEIKGDIAGSKDEITAQITSTETDLNTLINSVRSELVEDMESHDASIDTQLTNLEVSLTATIGNTEEKITADLRSMNGTIISLINSVRNEILSSMMPYLEDINQTSTQIYTDTQWLVLNAMNQADKADIDVRFTDVDNNLALIRQFCSNTQTETSDLCQEVDQIISTVDTIRSEQTEYYNDLDLTTTSTLDLLTGTFTENINTILADLGILKDTTADINATVNAIRADQVNQIVVSVIS